MEWPDIIQIIGQQYGYSFSVEDVNGMSFDEKSNWLRYNPELSPQHFHYCLHTFINFIRHHNIIGIVEDYAHRIEFFEIVLLMLI